VLLKSDLDVEQTHLRNMGYLILCRNKLERLSLNYFYSSLISLGCSVTILNLRVGF